VGPLQKEIGDLVTWVVEKAEVLSHFFASVFTSKCFSQLPKLQMARAGTRRMKNHPL